MTPRRVVRDLFAARPWRVPATTCTPVFRARQSVRWELVLFHFFL